MHIDIHNILCYIIYGGDLVPKRKRKKKPLTLRDVLKANKQGKNLTPKRKQSKYKTESEKAREKLDKLSDKDLKAYAEKSFKKAYMRLHRLRKAKNLSTAAKMHIAELSGYIKVKTKEFDRAIKGLDREKLIDKIVKADKFSSYKSTSEAGNRRQFEQEADKHGLSGRPDVYSNYQKAWDKAREKNLFNSYNESEFKDALETIIFDSGANLDNFDDFFNAVTDFLTTNFEQQENDFKDLFNEDFDEPFTNPDFFD